jgi:glycosyltransferase involved in cell wall biosynthesis
VNPGRVLLASDAVGGVWQYTAELARGLAGGGVEVILAVAGPPPAPQQRRMIEGMPSVHLVACDLPLEWMAETPEELQALAGWIDDLAFDYGVDLVHLNGAGLADLLSAGPILVTHHSCLGTWWQAVRDEPLPEHWRWRLKRTANGLSAADLVIAPSRAFAAAIDRTYPGLAPARVIRNGRTPPRSFDDAPDREPLVLTAGRLWDEGKNAKTLDLAAASINWPTVALGPLDGPGGQIFQPNTMAAPGSVNDEEVGHWLGRSRIFVSLALYEPFGLAVLEAAAAGNALVLANIPTFRELWDGAALFVDPQDPEAAAHAVNRLIRDPPLRADLAVRAAERAEAYSAAACVASTLACYRCVLDRHGRLQAQAGPSFALSREAMI